MLETTNANFGRFFWAKIKFSEKKWFFQERIGFHVKIRFRAHFVQFLGHAKANANRVWKDVCAIFLQKVFMNVCVVVLTSLIIDQFLKPHEYYVCVCQCFGFFFTEVLFKMHWTKTIDWCQPAHTKKCGHSFHNTLLFFIIFFLHLANRFANFFFEPIDSRNIIL